MEHQVLARKWRPRTFSEVVGQEQVLQVLQNALLRQRLHSAYLFTGTRGVGKTTIARIFARCLNCKPGLTAEPCGECSACQEIVRGAFPDLVEVDAASRTGVDDTRQLLEDAYYPPAAGRYKVYLIDEVHMLSSSSFNAMLKTLEEPPEQTLFLLATTDPQKIPPTILSRCLQLALGLLPAELIAGHLAHVLGEEGIASEPDALHQISVAARGSMRDGLTLTDQAIHYTDSNITAEQVNRLLGTLDKGLIADLARALCATDTERTLDCARRVAQTGNCENALEQMLELLHGVAMMQVTGAAGSLDTSGEQREVVAELAGATAPEKVQLLYQIGLLGRRDLEMAYDAQQVFEMLLLRMLAFTPYPEQALSEPSPGGAAGAGGAAADSGGASGAAGAAANSEGATASGAAAGSGGELSPAGESAQANSPEKDNLSAGEKSSVPAGAQTNSAEKSHSPDATDQPANAKPNLQKDVQSPQANSLKAANQSEDTESSSQKNAQPTQTNSLEKDDSPADAKSPAPAGGPAPANAKINSSETSNQSANAKPSSQRDAEPAQTNSSEKPNSPAEKAAPENSETATAKSSQKDIANAPANSAPATADATDTPPPVNEREWAELVNGLPLPARLRAAFAPLGLLRCEGSQVTLHGSDDQLQMVTPDLLERFSQALAETGTPWRVQVQRAPDGAVGLSPETHADQAWQDYEREYRRQLNDLPLVQSLRERYGLRDSDITIERPEQGDGPVVTGGARDI